MRGSAVSINLHEPSVYGLNLTVPEDAKAVIKPWDERESNDKYLDSNVDDQARVQVACRLVVIWTITNAEIYLQLIVHVPFVENVRIKSILVKLGAPSPCDTRHDMSNEHRFEAGAR